MAYHQPPQGGYPPYGGQPPSHSPQPPYGAPPPGQYPPQGQPPYQQQYPPQGHSPYQQQQPYSPPPGQYGAPAPYGHAQYSQPPGGPPAGYPPQQGYGAPPPQAHHQYGAPPQNPPYQQPPANQSYYGGAPAAYAQPTPPSLGYVPGQMAPGEATHDADAINAAMKGFGTNEDALIRVMAGKDPLQMALIRSTFQHRTGKSLESRIASETSGHFRDGLLAIVRGPLAQDVYLLNNAVKGAGTKELVLNDVLLGRSNADMRAIKQEYQRLHRTPLEQVVRDDLSGTTERLFSMVIAANRAEESAPVIPQQTEQDITELHRATEARHGTDKITVCQIISSRSDGQLRAIVLAYEQKYRVSLERVIEKEFHGHTEAALLMMIRAGADRAMRDAKLLEAAMAGPGTKDDLLLNRIIRYHWDMNHLAQVKGAYRHKYGKELSARVRGETSGDYRNLLLACVR